MQKLPLLALASLICPFLIHAQEQNTAVPKDAHVLATSTVDHPDILRGYGKLKATFQTVSDGKNEFRVWQFDASSPKNAATASGKFLADVTLSPGVTRGTLDIGGKLFPLVTVDGGQTYTGFALGNTGSVISAATADALKTFLLSSPAAKSAGVVTELSYPQYLDRFDRYGWGFYGFKGNWNGGVDKDTLTATDPSEDLDFCAKHNFRFELWPAPTNFDDNYSVDERNAMGWEIEEAAKRGIPMSCRLYGGIPQVKQFTEAFEEPAFFLQGGWHNQQLQEKSHPHQSWFNPEGRLYMARQAQDQVRLLVDRPDIGSWMSPYGELFHDPWFNYHADYGPSATLSWRETLRDKQHLTLAQVSAMFGRSSKPFRTWDAVPIPEIATFIGLPGMVKDLDGNWYVRVEAQPGEGLAGEWWKADVKQTPWEKMNLPGAVHWLKYFGKTKWCVRDFDVTPADLAKGKPLYLYNFAKIYGNPHTLVPVYLNGEKIGETGHWGVLEVSKLLKPGHNRLAMETEFFSGRVFLSTDTPSVYPYLGPDRNHLWTLFNDWLSDGKHDAWAIGLAAMREVDPDRPIKFMAPVGFGTDRWIDLASRFGGFGHFTGEGQFAFLWYKRYSFLYGLPSTSEDAGPPNNVEEMASTYQRVFFEGLNGHDHVFTVQACTAKPDVRQWYENHIAVLKQLGRWDISGPQVILYRSTNSASELLPSPVPSLGEKTREIQSIWNWDFGRGSFPAIGQSTLYVDDGGLVDHKIDGYPLMVDCGNELMPERSLKLIEEWIRKGGTYVVLPFTGRSVPSAPDSWPIQSLTGCKVKALRKPGKDAGTVIIEQNQPLFKELAGKSFPDNGSTLDFQFFEHNLLSVELEPGADCQVAARYENGSPAIVVHKLGAGRVVTLGSAFFRQSKDVRGIWQVGEIETTFLRDLLTNLGMPSVNYASDPGVYVQRYRTNNGLDDVVVADNFAGADRTVALHVTLERKPEKVYQVAMNSIKEVSFTADGKDLTILNVTVPKEEVQVFYFRDRDAATASQHWLGYQQKIWRSTDPMKVDLSPISKPQWTDQAIDLKQGWKWTQESLSNDWTAPGFNDGEWKSWGLDIYSAVGADATKPLHALRTFTVPSGWLKDKGILRLVAAGWSSAFTVCESQWKLSLNGQVLQSKSAFFNPDVTSLLHEGSNTLALEIGPAKKGKYIGVIGSVYLSHTKLPEKEVSLAGKWSGTIDGKPISLDFPGKGIAVGPSRTFMVPADWKEKYVVTYYAKGSRESTAGVIVNERANRRHHHLFGEEVEVDITPMLHFGEMNTFEPQPGGTFGAPVKWDISDIQLRLYPRAEYRSSR